MSAFANGFLVTDDGAMVAAVVPPAGVPVGSPVLEGIARSHAGAVYVSVSGAAVNVMSYGADPTGATDSSAAFTSAIAAVVAEGGGIVCVPSGTFLLANVGLYNDIEIVGAGRGATTLLLTGRASATAHMFVWADGTEISFGAIRNMTILGGTSTGAKAGYNAIHLRAATGYTSNDQGKFIVDDCMIKWFKVGVHGVTGTERHLHLKNNHILENVAGVYIDGSTSGGHCEWSGQNHVRDNTYGLLHKSGFDMAIIGQYFVDNSYGIWPGDVASDNTISITTSGREPLRASTITGCFIRSSVGDVVVGDQCTVTGNTFMCGGDQEASITVGYNVAGGTTTKRVVINGNNFRDADGTRWSLGAIRVTGAVGAVTHLNIVNNVFQLGKNVTSYCIYIDGADVNKMNVIGNSADLTTGTKGFLLATGAGIDVIGSNICHNIVEITAGAGNAIDITQASANGNLLIEGNLLRLSGTATGYGISVENDDGTIRNNRVRGGYGINIRSATGLADKKKTVITAATRANPCVVTIAAHDLVNGESIFIQNVGGMTQLNGNTYTVANAATDTVELSGTDSSAYGVYTSGGNATKVGRDAYGNTFAAT